MSKMHKFLRAVSLIVTKPYLLNLILENKDSYREQAIKNYHLPNGLMQVNIIDLFPGFSETVEPYAFLEGSSLPVDIAILKGLAKKYMVKNYLEIGTWRGESVANVASVVENCYTVNLPDEELHKLGSSSEYINSHRHFSGNLPNVTHIQSHSHSFDFSSLGKKFDMVFIDGDHHYESVKMDTEIAFDILKDENSIIVWHDYGSSPESVRWGVMMGILDGSPPDKRDKIYHISNSLCAVYLNEKFRAQVAVPFARPDKFFRIKLEVVT